MKMAFNGTEGTFISLETGSGITELFRTTFLNNGRERKSVFFGKEKLEAILSQTNCMGIRCYFGAEQVTGTGGPVIEMSLVLVGAVSNMDDQITSMDKILDFGSPCPTNCPPTSNPLNS